MGQALGNILPLAIAVAVFPIPIIASVLIVGADRGRAKGLAFVLAWCAGLSAVGALMLWLGSAADASEGGKPSTWVSGLLLGLGLLALAAAVKQWLSRPGAGEETPVPGWMRKVDDFTIAKAAAAGFALTALNPKNVLLTVAAAAEIAEVGLSPNQEIVAMVVFVVVASAGVLAPLVVALALGDRSRELLDGLRGWMARHNAAIMAVLFVFIGAKLIGDAISGFSS
jgi:threonine/homoserine/homoserine lactone efflux protein